MCSCDCSCHYEWDSTREVEVFVGCETIVIEGLCSFCDDECNP